MAMSEMVAIELLSLKSSDSKKLFETGILELIVNIKLFFYNKNFEYSIKKYIL